jgi:hypothetical protein
MHVSWSGHPGLYIKKLSELNNWKVTILHKDEQLITFCRFEVLYVVEMSDLTEEITSTRYYFIIISNQNTWNDRKWSCEVLLVYSQDVLIKDFNL